MHEQLRRKATNTVLVLVSIAFCTLMLEGGVRVYAGLLFPKMMVLDDTLGWRHITNAKKSFKNELGEQIPVLLDDFGNRGSGHPKNPPAGKYRILALGDSFTEGVQVSESDVFTAQLERADSHLDVINAGVGGYGTVQEYLYLESEGVQFKPDLVLLMFYANDLTDNILTYYPGFGPRPYATLTAGNVEIERTLDDSAFKRFVLPVPFEMALNKHSYLYYFVNSRIYQPMFSQRMRQEQQADLQQIDVEKRYRVFFGLLDKLNYFLQERKVSFLAVIIPTSDEVANRQSDVAVRITEHCQQQGISCLSLLDRFVKQSLTGAPLYFREDIHWTRQGHELAAHEILNHLRMHNDMSVREAEHEVGSRYN